LCGSGTPHLDSLGFILIRCVSDITYSSFRRTDFNAEDMFAADRGIYMVHNRFVDESDRVDWLEAEERGDDRALRELQMTTDATNHAAIWYALSLTMHIPYNLSIPPSIQPHIYFTGMPTVASSSATQASPWLPSTTCKIYLNTWPRSSRTTALSLPRRVRERA
jgi:hypothetical protein